MCRIHFVHVEDLTQLANYTEKEARNILTTYTKFSFVRNPIDRLISAWNDKFGPRDTPSKFAFKV